jgi:nucleoside 2-deoxyribosyltransferase
MTARSTNLLAISGAGVEPMPTAWSAESFAARCAEIVTTMRGHSAHRELDLLTNEVLASLGFGEGIRIFEAAVTHWHGEAERYPYPESCPDCEGATMKSIYLCGPINGCTDEECTNWRELVKSKWQGRCIDPMVRDYRGREAEAYREIVELDKIDVVEADIILVNYDKPSVGTAMEILYAWERGKRIVVVAREDAVISPWLRYHATNLVHSFDDALRVIEAA